MNGQADFDPAKDYSPGEIAKATGWHENTVRRWIWSGKLPAKKRQSGEIIVSGAEINAYFVRRNQAKPYLIGTAA